MGNSERTNSTNFCFMKKLALVCLFSSFLFFSYGQVLFTYGNHPVTTAEFLKAFNKNKTGNGNKSKRAHPNLVALLYYLVPLIRRQKNLFKKTGHEKVDIIYAQEKIVQCTLDGF